MPFAEINLVPSVNIVSTDADNPSGVSESNFIRWKGALPEKRGGCSLYINQQLSGIPNDIQPWGDIDGTPFVSVSTNLEVYNYNSVTASNSIISPNFINKPSVSPDLTTTKGSSLVKVTDSTTLDVTVYDSVTFNVPVSIGGLILQGTYPISQASGSFSYIIDAGYNATSSVTSGGTVPVFVTTSGSTEITVNFPIEYQYGKLAVGDRIGFEVPTNVGGLTIAGQYIVTKILSSTSFSFIDDQIAPSSDSAPMNNGNLNLTYWLVFGPTVTGTGYGANQYGQYAYGSGTVNPPLSGNTYRSNSWYLDNRGSTLIASATGGPIFYWNDSFGYKNLAILNNAPIRSNGAFVAMPLGHIMAWGCSDVINPLQNPLYIRWSDAKDPDNWSISGNSDAGFYNIPTGSKIVRGLQGPTQQYWFTDIDLYVAQYIGYPGTYGFNKVGSGCGLVAPRAVATMGNAVYWMSQRQFFVCPNGGAPQPIPCSVWDFIFQNMDPSQTEAVVCGTNSLFNEVSWFFPQRDDNLLAQGPSYSKKPTAYVCYNTQYNEWDVGYLNRTTWYDQSLAGGPLATDSNGWVYQHDTTYNNAVGNSIEPINAWLKTGYFSLTSGQDLSFVDWILPDFKWGEYSDPPDAQLKMTFYVTDYAGQEPRVHGPYTFNKLTKFINPRMRGRFIAFKIESDDLNSFWRVGSIRYRFAGSGRR